MPSEVEGDAALARIKAQWHASTWDSSFPYSHRIKVALLHTWYVGRAKDDSHPILLGHVCEEFHYLPGFAPKEQAKEFHLTQDNGYKNPM